MRKLILCVPMLLLGGCAEYQAAAAGVDKAATQAVQNVNDDALHVEIQGICGQPYSSLVRNVGTVKGLAAGILALCGPVPAPGASAVFGGIVQTPSGSPAP